MALEITSTEHVIRILTIQLKGRFDAFEAPKVRSVAEQAIAEGVKHFVFDLAQAEMIDSAGLAVMVSMLKRARLNNGDVRLIWPKDETAARILRLTKFDQVFRSIEPAQIVPTGF